MKWPTRAWGQRRGRLLIDPGDAGLVGGWNLREADDVIPDQSANFNDGTIVGPVGMSNVSGRGMYFDGVNDYVDIGDTDQTVKTVEMVVRPYTATEQFLDLDGGTHYIQLNAAALESAGFDTPTRYINGLTGGFDDDAMLPNLTVHIVVTTETGFEASDLDIGRIGKNYGNADIWLLGLYSDVKTQAWATQRAANIIKAAHYDSLWGAIESVAAEGGTIGQYLSNTGYQFVDATTRWRVGSDLVIGGAVAAEPYKSVYPTVGGYVFQDNIELGLSTAEMLYGTWKFSMYKNSAGDEVNYVMGSSATGAVFNGYYVQFDASERLRLYERTGAAAATVLGTAAAALDLQTWYDVYVTRTYAGLWRLYYKEATSPTWIQVGDGATDTTHLTATYRQLGASANSRIGWATRSGNHSMTQLLGVVAP